MPLTPQKSRRDRLGQIFTWLSGGALALSVLMILGLLGLLAYMGMGYFWPKSLFEIETNSGRKFYGELHDRERIPSLSLPAEQRKEGTQKFRINVKVGNRDVYKETDELDFRWIDEDDIKQVTTPEDLAHLERLEWGNFHGKLVELRKGGKKLDVAPGKLWNEFQTLVAKKARDREAVHALEKGDIGDVSFEINRLVLAERRVEIDQLPPDEAAKRLQKIRAERQELQKKSDALTDRLIAMREQLNDTKAVFSVADSGQEHREIAIGDVVRAIRPNAMSTWDKLCLYVKRIWEFMTDQPRETNTEGGIFPAIFGTVLMVFLMTFAVTPLGVLAALYLREYAKDGPVVRLVRIAVNNLAGVPSIVFGVFGLGFFVYLIGGSIDKLFYPERLPVATFGTGGILWAALTLALLTVPVVIVATEEGLAAVPRIVRQGSLALGATKFETITKVVIPAAGPGILTGIILAISRAAGEVAPLMIVGMVKLAPALPFDHHFPFFHLERKFMHLGFHIYDVGFQSPNVDATKPLVYATALLLVGLVTVMNLVAIAIRNRLRKKYATSAV